MNKKLYSLIVSFVLLLTSCATHQQADYATDMSVETWQKKVNTDSRVFAKGASPWFLKGESQVMGNGNRMMSTMAIQTPYFNEVSVNGAFQVQITGADQKPSVRIQGPAVLLAAIVVEVRGNRLYLSQKESDQKQYTNADMKRVIVHINVPHLRHLIQRGCGSIEAIYIRTDDLCLTSTALATGNIYIAGYLRARRIDNAGSGSINAWGVDTRELAIATSGKGDVHVTGNVGVRAINHCGSGSIAVIGANSHALDIYAEGSGKISIKGQVNIKTIKARDKTCVYAYAVESGQLLAQLSGKVKIGLSGSVRDLNVNASGNSFFAGRYLCAERAYVKTSDRAHVNVMSSERIFASTSQSSTIYFFGLPQLLSSFVSSNSSVIVMNGNVYPRCPIHPERYVYHGEMKVTYPYNRWTNSFQ